MDSLMMVRVIGGVVFVVLLVIFIQRRRAKSR